MDGTQVVTEALTGLSSGFFALIFGLLMVIGGFYLMNSIWIILGRRT